MTEPASDQQWQELLKGAEGPRPLPAALRERLLDELGAPVVAPGTGEAAREPIPAALRGRLEVALGARHRARRRSFAVSLGGIAAVVAGLALLFGGTGGAGRTGQRESLGTARQSVARSAAPAKGPTGNAGPVNAGRAAATKPSPGPTTPGTGTPAGRSPGHSFSAAVRAPASPRPGALSMSPRQGPVSGGNPVVLSGARLSAVRAVYFGGAKGTILRRPTPASMVVRVPAHPAGRALVTFSTTGAVSPAAPVYYRYMGGGGAR